MNFQYYLVNHVLQSDEHIENKLSQDVLKKYNFQQLDLNIDAFPNYPCIIFAHTTYLESSQVTPTMLQRFKNKVNNNLALLVMISGSSDSLQSIATQCKQLQITLNEKIYIVDRSVTQSDLLKESDVDKILSLIYNHGEILKFKQTYQAHKTIIIPLSILCQGYLAVHPNTSLNRELTAYLPQNVSERIKKTEYGEWWKKPLTNKTKDTLTEKITAEWQPQKLPIEVSDLIKAIYSNTFITDVNMVEVAYKAIAARLTSI